MDYIFGSATHDGVTSETLLTVGTEHTDLTGEVEVCRAFPGGDLIDHFRAVARYRSTEDGEGRCYDWYLIDHHYRYADQSAAVQSSRETEALTLELAADYEARLCNLELGV